MDYIALLATTEVDGITSWFQSVSALSSALIGIIGLFGATGGLAVLFYRVQSLEKHMKEYKEHHKKDIARLHERIDTSEEEGKPIRDLVKEMQTDLKWIKKHLASLEGKTSSKVPSAYTKPPVN